MQKELNAEEKVFVYGNFSSENFHLSVKMRKRKYRKLIMMTKKNIKISCARVRECRCWLSIIEIFCRPTIKMKKLQFWLLNDRQFYHSLSIVIRDHRKSEKTTSKLTTVKVIMKKIKKKRKVRIRYGRKVFDERRTIMQCRMHEKGV